MKSSKSLFLIFTAVVLWSAAAQAAHVDMNDPRRALGREDDVRVDAQLTEDNVSSGAPLAATYQIQNLSSVWIAVADKVSDVSYDMDSQTLTLSIGAEVPTSTMPHMVAIAPGEKKTLTAAATVNVLAPRNRFTRVPRFVQVRVNILRDLSPFQDLIARQSTSPVPLPVSNDLFDKWIQSADSIFLNAVPIEWRTGGGSAGATSAEHRGMVRSPSVGW